MRVSERAHDLRRGDDLPGVPLSVFGEVKHQPDDVRR